MIRILAALLALALSSTSLAQRKINATEVTVDGAGRLDTVVNAKVATTDTRLPVKDDTHKTVTIVSSMPITEQTQNSLAIGYGALQANVDSDATTAIGTDAAAGTTNGRTSTYVGYRAGYRANGSSNSCYGAYTCGAAAGAIADYPAMLGNDNTVMGEAAGLFMQGVGPNFNSLYGFNAGFAIRAGDSNSFFGNGSGRSLVNGGKNVAVGVSSMKWAIGGDSNVFVGGNAGQGRQDVHTLSAALAQGGTTLYFSDNPTTWASVGDVLAAGGCLYDPAVSTITAVYSDRVTIDTPANTSNCGVGSTVTNTHLAATGQYNVAIGASALIGLNGSMSFNTAVGGVAGQSLAATNDSNARFNTLLGYSSGSTLTTGSRNITLGYNAEVPSTTADGQMSLGNLIYATGRTGVAGTGLLGIGRSDPAFRLHVAGTMGIDSPSATGSGDVPLCWNGTTKEVRQGTGCAPGSTYTASGGVALVGSDFRLATSPALTGTPTAPTAIAGTNTTQIATTAYVVTGAHKGVSHYTSGNVRTDAYKRTIILDQSIAVNTNIIVSNAGTPEDGDIFHFVNINGVSGFSYVLKNLSAGGTTLVSLNTGKEADVVYDAANTTFVLIHSGSVSATP